MKKSLFARAGLLCAALTLTLSLAACGAPAAQSVFSVDDADTLLASGAFDPSMAPVDQSVIPALYAGLDGAAIQDSVCYMATNTSVSADELTILVMADEAAAQAALDACQARVDSQIAVCQSYAPAAVPRLEGAVVRQAGNTVLLAVGDPETLPAAVDALLN